MHTLAGWTLDSSELVSTCPLNLPRCPLLCTQVLDYLLPEMENRRGKLVVVLAGYAKPMEELMGHNEGLPSRFAQVGVRPSPDKQGHWRRIGCICSSLRHQTSDQPAPLP